MPPRKRRQAPEGPTRYLARRRPSWRPVPRPDAPPAPVPVDDAPPADDAS
jgi:hypothetical protein